MIWEDRKFNDIGKTLYKQINNGVFKVAEWADFVSVVPIAGDGFKYAFNDTKQVGVFLLLEMSSKNNLMNYLKKINNV